jgi:23S rRNA pseudouridine1911/1915/1917 synthase
MRESVHEFTHSTASNMIEILLEHPWYLVINKPSGLLTQAVPGIESVQTRLVEQLFERDRSGPTPFIGIPHRLDRVTSGAMVVARNQRALRRLSDQFAARKVSKIYHAIIPRIESDGQVLWRDWMRKIENEPKAEIVPNPGKATIEDPLSKEIKEAVLRFHAIHHCEVPLSPSSDQSLAEPSTTSVSASLVEIELETGRMHQIRLQFASRGYPILGDMLYGSPWPWLHTQAGLRESPIALHAQTIEFRDPKNAEQVSVKAPYPVGWPQSK